VAMTLQQNASGIIYNNARYAHHEFVVEQP
jgi:hypothetical protein